MYETLSHIFGCLNTSERAIKQLEKTIKRQTSMNKSLFVITATIFVIRELQIRDMQHRLDEIEKESRENTKRASRPMQETGG